MDIKQNDEITLKGTVTGIITTYKRGELYRVKIGNNEIWITPKEVKEDE